MEAVTLRAIYPNLIMLIKGLHKVAQVTEDFQLGLCSRLEVQGASNWVLSLLTCQGQSG